MKKYEQLYNSIKNMILTNQLKAGQKVPSIRKTAQIYNLSVTTVQNAYFELCADGYIISKEKSGYFVTHIADKAENKQTKSKAKSAMFLIFLFGKDISKALCVKKNVSCHTVSQKVNMTCAVPFQNT